MRAEAKVSLDEIKHWEDLPGIDKAGLMDFVREVLFWFRVLVSIWGQTLRHQRRP